MAGLLVLLVAGLLVLLVAGLLVLLVAGLLGLLVLLVLLCFILISLSSYFSSGHLVYSFILIFFNTYVHFLPIKFDIITSIIY